MGHVGAVALAVAFVVSVSRVHIGIALRSV